MLDSAKLQIKCIYARTIQDEKEKGEIAMLS
jgi:hypothetical protein